MKALSILQPWAWLIVNGYKDIENRRWRTPYRGRFLVHAGKRWGKEQRDDYMWVIANTEIGLDFPSMYDFEKELGFRGGIVGAATITDCISESASPWFFGPWGFALTEQVTSPFIPYRGQLGWFDVPPAALAHLPQENPDV